MASYTAQSVRNLSATCLATPLLDQLQEKLGYFILYPYKGMDLKFQALSNKKEFHGVNQQT